MKNLLNGTTSVEVSIDNLLISFFNANKEKKQRKGNV